MTSLKRRHAEESSTDRGEKRCKKSTLKLTIDSQAADTVGETVPVEMSHEKEGSRNSDEDRFETPPPLNEADDASTAGDIHSSETTEPEAEAESESGYTSDNSTANLNDNSVPMEEQLHSMIRNGFIFPFTIILGPSRGERNSRETGSVDEKSDEGSISGS